MTSKTYIPLPDDGGELVTGEGHAVEVGQDVAALDLLGDETELAKVGLVRVQVSERHLEDAALETVRGDLRSLRAVHQRLANLQAVFDVGEQKKIPGG